MGIIICCILPFFVKQKQNNNFCSSVPWDTAVSHNTFYRFKCINLSFCSILLLFNSKYSSGWPVINLFWVGFHVDIIVVAFIDAFHEKVKRIFFFVFWLTICLLWYDVSLDKYRIKKQVSISLHFISSLFYSVKNIY